MRLRPRAEAEETGSRYGRAMMRRLPVPALDLALALLLLAATLAELLAGDAWGDGRDWLQVVAPAFASLTLAARRRAPFAAVLAYSAAVGVMCVATEPPQILSLGLAGMLMTYSDRRRPGGASAVGRWRGLRAGRPRGSGRGHSHFPTQSR